jgi:hypothetical protein
MHELLGAPNTAYLTGWLLVVDHYDRIGYISTSVFISVWFLVTLDVSILSKSSKRKLIRMHAKKKPYSTFDRAV